MIKSLSRFASVTLYLLCVISEVTALPDHGQYVLSADLRVSSLPKWNVTTPPPLDKRQLNKTLLPLTFDPLPLGSIKPLGWMKDQLRLMADGLPGHEYDFYRLVKDATWMGGDQEYSVLNEAWPYWFNGLVPLAYALDDDRLKAQVLQVIEYVLDHQFADGWLGPESELKKRNFWGRYPFFLGLTQLVDVVGPTQSERLISAMHRFVDLMHSMLSDHYQGYVLKEGDEFVEHWGRARAADMVISLQWLLEKHPRNNTEHIHESMVMLYEKSYDWSHWYSEGVYIKDDLGLYPDNFTQALFPHVHVVNAGQGLKFGAVMNRLVRNDTLLKSTRQGIEWTFKYHGTPSGAVIGDEIEGGLSPVRGTELCSVVESMFSFTYLYQALGERDFADRAELAAYNALPVMVTPDWWARQYIGQTNQVVSHPLDHQPFSNAGPLGQTYGLETNGPCCTVNFPQGYPKFLSASFVSMGDVGIAHVLLMPAQVSTTLDRRNEVRIQCDTKYPFENVLHYSIQATKSFTFSVRVPQWAATTQVVMNDHPIDHVQADAVTGLHTLTVPAGKTSIVVTFSTSIRIESRANDTVSVHYGALLYALPIPSISIHHRPEHYPGDSAPHEAGDWDILPIDPGYKWNIAVDPSTVRLESDYFSSPEAQQQPQQHFQTDQKSSLPNPIWSIDAPPNRLSIMACELSNWKLTSPTGGYAPDPPPLPAGSRRDKDNCADDPFRVVLQPYGALKLHVAQFPVVDFGTGKDDSEL